MSTENDGIIASSTIGDGGTQDKSTDEQTVPYARFKKLNDKYKEDKAQWEKRFEKLEALVNSGNATSKQEAEYEELAKLSPAEALKRATEIAEERALNRLRSENAKSKSESEQALQLLDDGFDHLRDLGHKINASTEKELSKIAMDYKINIESPEDFEKVYDLYEKLQKTKGAGNSKNAETIGTQTRKTTTTNKIDTRGSFSEVAMRSYDGRKS